MSDATPPPPPADPYGGQQPRMSPADEKLWATLIHIGGIFFGFIPSLIGYLVLKDRGPFVRDHSRNALNFQITMNIAIVVAWILAIVLIFTIVLPIILWLVVVAIGILVIIFSIIPAVKANQGLPYVYPLTIPFIN